MHRPHGHLTGPRLKGRKRSAADPNGYRHLAVPADTPQGPGKSSPRQWRRVIMKIAIRGQPGHESTPDGPTASRVAPWPMKTLHGPSGSMIVTGGET